MANLFNRGDFVIGTRCGHCGINTRSLYIVRGMVSWNGTMTVEGVGGSKYYSDRYYRVNQRDFDAITIEEYLRRYPDAIIDYSKNGVGSITDNNVEYYMDMEKQYDITPEERDALITEVFDYLKKNYKTTTREAVELIVDEWVKNKGWIIAIFKKHPNYNGRYQIVFDEDYQRKFDRHVVDNFACWVRDYRHHVLEGSEVTTSSFSYRELKRIQNKLYETIGYIGAIKDDLKTTNVLINGKTLEEYKSEAKYFEGIEKLYKRKIASGEIVVEGNVAFDARAYKMYCNLYSLSCNLRNLTCTNITEENAATINKMFDVKAVAGQKLSRIINKIMTYTGLANLPDYNKVFSSYSDAVNPLSITRHTILSVHPIDYLTMSDGNSWTSCHSVRNRGQYHSGTMSYMMDRASFVYYTVDKSYNGSEYHYQPKIVRCMFHMGYEKLVQGRVYPQATDGDDSAYLEIRNIVRRVLSNAMGCKDDWTIRKGARSCSEEIQSKGTHYKDYASINNCNISRIKREDKFVSNKKIVVGSAPICVKCGQKHNSTSRLTCLHC